MQQLIAVLNQSFIRSLSRVMEKNCFILLVHVESIELSPSQTDPQVEASRKLNVGLYANSFGQALRAICTT